MTGADKYIYTTKQASEVSGAAVSDIAVRRKQGLLDGGELRGRSLYYSTVDVVRITIMQELMQDGISSQLASTAGQISAEIADRYLYGQNMPDDPYVVIGRTKYAGIRVVTVVMGMDGLRDHITINNHPATVLPVIPRIDYVMSNLSNIRKTKHADKAA